MARRMITEQDISNIEKSTELAEEFNIGNDSVELTNKELILNDTLNVNGDIYSNYLGVADDSIQINTDNDNNSIDSTSTSKGFIIGKGSNYIKFTTDNTIQVVVNGMEYEFQSDGLYLNGVKITN